jgi:formate-dependent nitrite reductase membrane component NrfD
MFLMTEDKEKEEIIVRAPSKPVVSPEKRAEKAIEKALEEERFETIQVSSKIGSYFGASVVFAGVLLLCLFAYIGITGQVGLIILSSEATAFSLVLWVFVGIVNIISGFLLMGSE